MQSGTISLNGINPFLDDCTAPLGNLLRKYNYIL